MTEAAVGFAGNLTDDPEVRYTEAGIARAMFRVAVSGRREQEASFFGSGSYLVMDTTCAQTASARVAWQ